MHSEIILRHQKLELISSAKNAVASERAATSFVLEHLFEIEKRRLHIESGYASLHEFAVTELGYSDGAAYRRISAMRLITKVPEAKVAIDSGALSLPNAALVQNVVKEAKKQKKEIGVPLLELTKRVESSKAKTTPCKTRSYAWRRKFRRALRICAGSSYPIAKGGQSTLENIQTLCRSYNQWKGSNSLVKQ